MTLFTEGRLQAFERMMQDKSCLRVALFRWRNMKNGGYKTNCAAYQ